MQNKKDLEKALTAERLQLPKLEKEESRLYSEYQHVRIALDKCKANIEILEKLLAAQV